MRNDPSDTTSDAHLVEAARAGDQQAFDQLYQRYFHRLVGFCGRQLGDRDEAADVAQETFLLASRYLHQIEQPTRFRAWLYVIASRETARRLRRRHTDMPISDLAEAGEPVDTQFGPEQAAVVGDRLLILLAAAEGLDCGDRALIGFYLEGLDGPELAAALGAQPAAVRVQLHRARRRLKLSLDALAVARGHGRRVCGRLDVLLTGWDGTFTPLVRKRVARHIEQCSTCAARRDRLVTPEAMLGLLVFLAALPGEREEVLDELHAVSATLPVDPTSPGDADGHGLVDSGGGVARQLVRAAPVVAVLLVLGLGFGLLSPKPSSPSQSDPGRAPFESRVPAPAAVLQEERDNESGASTPAEGTPAAEASGGDTGSDVGGSDVGGASTPGAATPPAGNGESGASPESPVPGPVPVGEGNTAPDDIVSPSTADLVLAPGGTGSLPLQVPTAALPARADVVLLIDTTNTMDRSGAIDQAQREATQLMRRVSDRIPGARFALVEVRDYDFADLGGSEPFRVRQRFTADAVELTDAIGRLRTGTGGSSDEPDQHGQPEAYSTALAGVTNHPALQYRGNAERAVVLFADDLPRSHQQRPNFPGCTPTGSVDPGPDGEGLRYPQALQMLRANDQRLFMVSYGRYFDCYQQMSASTGGSAVRGGTAGALSRDLSQRILRDFRTTDRVGFQVVPADCQLGVTFTPDHLGGSIRLPQTLGTTAVVTAPAAPGSYTCQVAALVGGRARGSTAFTVEVRAT